MPSIIDQYNGDPVYAHLHVLTRDFPLAREMLKTASFETAKNTLDDLPSSAFAWEDERRFPIHTREDTLASIFYRSKLGSFVPPHVDQKLALAQSIYKLDESVFAPIKKASAEPGEYALPESSRLPLNNVEQIKVAEEVLLRDYDSLTLEKRADAFNRLYTAANKHGVALRPFSKKMAGATASNTAVLRDWLEARADAAAEPQHKVAFEKLAQATTKMPNLLVKRNDLTKLAVTIAELDERAGLKKYYDRRLPDPLLTVFNTEKIAEATCDVAGIEVPCSVLMQLPPDVWESVDAPEMAQAVQAGDPEQFAQIFATLPLDVKTQVRAYVSNA
jgi:hypothetical protein